MNGSVAKEFNFIKSENTMNHVSKNFGTPTALQEGRLAKGWSLEDMAITTGLTIAEIKAVERGDVAPAHNVERIEHALK
jgi:ribosome-binding protein aMBF1 (putative translation factor)